VTLKRVARSTHTASTSTQNKNDRHDNMPRAAFICICVSRSSSAISSPLLYATMMHSPIPRPIAAATQVSSTAFQKHNNQQHLVSTVGPSKHGVNPPCRLLTFSIPCINACPLLTLSILCINNDTLCHILIYTNDDNQLSLSS
jgi:hypothetical protein